jgi:TM2 domain-containing membrane protein YozV
MGQYSEAVAWLMWGLGFVGCCGVHRCYLGKVSTGFLYFFTEGMCWLGQIADAIQLTEMVKEANGNKHSHTVTVVVVRPDLYRRLTV